MACHSVPRVLTLGDSASVEIIVLTPRAVERLHTDLGASFTSKRQVMAYSAAKCDYGLGTQV